MRTKTNTEIIVNISYQNITIYNSSIKYNTNLNDSFTFINKKHMIIIYIFVKAFPII